MVYLPGTARLLRRHVVGCPGYRPGPCDRGFHGAPDNLGNTEIEQLHEDIAGLRVCQEYVVGLEVPMDNLLIVRRFQGREHLHGHADGRLGREVPVVSQHTSQRVPLKEGHDQVGRVVLRSTRVDDLAYVFVTDGRCGLGFAMKPSPGIRTLVFPPTEHLDRYHTPCSKMGRLEDTAHSARSDKLVQSIFCVHYFWYFNKSVHLVNQT